jgi:hypothetical protein
VNRKQTIAVIVAVFNLLLIGLFPPYDQYSLGASQMPAFSGFQFVLRPLPYSELNQAVLLLEIFVVLINTGVAWLLLRDKPAGGQARSISYANAALIFVGINLVLVLLFPPFEAVFALTNPALPGFQGFYPIFLQRPNQTIAITVLYLEVIFLLVNGALLWLIFRESARAPRADRMPTLAGRMRRQRDA